MDYKLCLPDYEDKKTCPTDKPYCVQAKSGDSCAITPDFNIDLCKELYKPKPMKCHILGRIPDHKYCNFYHDCERLGNNSTVSACPYDASYNYKLQICEPNLSQACNSVNCSKISTFAPYGDGYNRWYGYCDIYRDSKYMFKCRAGFKMNYTINVCEFVCPTDEYYSNKLNFCDKSDYSLHYECYRRDSYSSLNQVVRTYYCPPGYLFNLEQRRCTETAEAKETHKCPECYASCNYKYDSDYLV